MSQPFYLSLRGVAPQRHDEESRITEQDFIQNRDSRLHSPALAPGASVRQVQVSLLVSYSHRPDVLRENDMLLIGLHTLIGIKLRAGNFIPAWRLNHQGIICIDDLVCIQILFDLGE